MISQERWQRYRRDSILFAVVWLVLGFGTLLVGNLEPSAEAQATAWGWAFHPFSKGAVAIGLVGVLYTVFKPFSDSFDSRHTLGLSLLGVLMPLHVFLLAYVVVAAEGATAGVLVASTTFAWVGVTNLGSVGLVSLANDHDRRTRKSLTNWILAGFPQNKGGAAFLNQKFCADCKISRKGIIYIP